MLTRNTQKPRYKVVCLDLEATLISNSVSVFPRPGLAEFLEGCLQLFGRVAIFTTVPETRFRDIAALLVSEGTAPSWFSTVEYVRWEGQYKDLGFVQDALPDQVLLVDDMEVYVKPSQRDFWVEVQGFEPPFDQKDVELYGVLDELRRRAACRGDT